MRCSKCGQEIPDGSMVCGYCGEKLSGEASTAPVTPEAGTAPEPAMTQEATQTAETSADQQVSPGVPPEIADTPGEKKKKSHLGRIALIVILALVVVLGVIGFIFRDVFANFYHRTFDSPEKYFRYVQNRRIDKAAEDIADAYESWIQSGKLFSQSHDVTVTFEMEDAFKDLLELAEKGEDPYFSWLDSFTVHMQNTLSEEGIAMEGDLTINEVDLLSFVSILNLDENMICMQIPQITEEFIGVEADAQYGIERSMETYKNLKNLYEALPTKDEVKKLVARYGKVFAECIDEVDRDSDTLTAEGISQNCTVLEFDIDEDVITEAAERMLDMIKEDEELESVLRRLCEVEGLGGEDGPDSDEIYEKMMDTLVKGLEKAVENKEELSSAMAALNGSAKLYVASNGDVIGTKMTSGKKGQQMVVKDYLTRSGGKIGYELTVDVNGINVSLSGNGKEHGGKVTGEFALEVIGTEYLEIETSDFDINAISRGELKGRIHIEPGVGLTRLMGNSSMTASFTKTNLDLEMDIKGDEQMIAITANDRDERLFMVRVEQKTGKARSLEIPEDVAMNEDIDRILDDEKIADDLIEAFEEAGLPDEVVEGLRANPGMVSQLYNLCASLVGGSDFNSIFYRMEDPDFGDF